MEKFVDDWFDDLGCTGKGCVMLLLAGCLLLSFMGVSFFLWLVLLAGAPITT